MKFYKDIDNYTYYWEIIFNKLNAVYIRSSTLFYTKTMFLMFNYGLLYSIKNIASINYNYDKNFYLNGKYYGNQYNFNKKSWRRLVKLKCFI